MYRGIGRYITRQLPPSFTPCKSLSSRPSNCTFKLLMGRSPPTWSRRATGEVEGGMLMMGVAKAGTTLFSSITAVLSMKAAGDRENF
jgi:hypothetical protein